MNESSYICSIFLASGIVSVLDFGHSNRCVVAFHCFNLHFPDTYDVGHLFMCLLPSILSSLGFTCGSAGKESAHNVGDLGSIPGSGRSTREGNGILAWRIPWTV